MGYIYQNQGEFFPDTLQKEIRNRFHMIDADPDYGRRLFFENSGGSLRLKSVVRKKAYFEQFPDCPERAHQRSADLQQVRQRGLEDVRHTICGAEDGAVITQLTASSVMFQIAETIAENVGGTNIITSVMEHPSAYDAAKYAAEKTGKDFRAAGVNPVTGGIDVDEVLRLVDENTCFISIMSASNISGTIMDIKEIVRRARMIKPDVYVITDAVQHAPHGVIDVKDSGVDAVNFAPYKFFGNRGVGFGWVSPRLAKLRHHKLLAKSEDVWELGTPTPSNFACLSDVVDYVCWLGGHFADSEDRRTLYVEGMRRIHLQERALLYRLLEGSEKAPGLRHMNHVKVYTDTEDLTMRDLIVAAGFDNIGFADATAEYQRRGCTVFERIMGSPYSQRMIEALGIPGAIRISPIHCHDKKDIDAFLQITAEIAAL